MSEIVWIQVLKYVPCKIIKSLFAPTKGSYFLSYIPFAFLLPTQHICTNRELPLLSSTMSYKAYLYVLMTLSVWQAVAFPSHAHQPHFPENCNISLIGDPEVRQLPPLFWPQLTVYRCTLVGDACASTSDCPVPRKEDCVVPPNPEKKPVLSPVRAHCIDGFCRNLSDQPDTKCDCLVGCEFKRRASTRDMSCIDGRCQLAACAPCGEAPNNRQCCGSGVVGFDGNCYCATGVGEGCATNPNKCRSGKFNDICCGKGTKQEGFCCATGTCDGQCRHEPF